MREKWSNSSIDSDAETEYKLYTCLLPTHPRNPGFQGQLKGSVKELNISIYFFLRPSLNGVLFPMFCLLVDGNQILVFKNIIN